MSEHRWKYVEHDDSKMHVTKKIYFESGYAFCSECECALVDHEPQPASYQFVVTFKTSSLRDLQDAMQELVQGSATQAEMTTKSYEELYEE